MGKQNICIWPYICLSRIVCAYAVVSVLWNVIHWAVLLLSDSLHVAYTHSPYGVHRDLESEVKLCLRAIWYTFLSPSWLHCNPFDTRVKDGKLWPCNRREMANEAQRSQHEGHSFFTIADLNLSCCVCKCVVYSIVKSNNSLEKYPRVSQLTIMCRWCNECCRLKKNNSPLKQLNIWI